MRSSGGEKGGGVVVKVMLFPASLPAPTIPGFGMTRVLKEGGRRSVIAGDHAGGASNPLLRALGKKAVPC